MNNELFSSTDLFDPEEQSYDDKPSVDNTSTIDDSISFQ
jgi:hypothetical protein